MERQARAIVIDEFEDLYSSRRPFFHKRRPRRTMWRYPVLDTDIFVEKLNPVDGSLSGTSHLFIISSTQTMYPQWSFGTGIAVDRDGYAYVGGYTIRKDIGNSSNAGDVTFELLKLESSGDLFWHSYYPAGPHPGKRHRGLWSTA